MSSASKDVAVLFLMAFAVCLGGCRSSTNPPPAASGDRAAVSDVPGAAAVNAALHRTNPVDRDPMSIQNGRRLFMWYNCYACHGPHGGGAIGPSLRDRMWRYGDSDSQIFTSIAQGRPNGMPTWGNKVPEIQVWELVAYIRSMGTTREPDPPQAPANESSSDPKELSPPAPETLNVPAGGNR